MRPVTAIDLVDQAWCTAWGHRGFCGWLSLSEQPRDRGTPATLGSFLEKDHFSRKNQQGVLQSTAWLSGIAGPVHVGRHCVLVSEAQGPGWTGDCSHLPLPAQSIRVHFLAPCWWWAAGPLVHWSTGPLLLGKVAWKADGHPSIRTGFRLLAPAAQLPHRRALRVESGNCPACCPVHGSSAFIMPA